MLTAVPLIFARVVGLCWTAPAWNNPGLEARSRLIGAALLTATVSPILMQNIKTPVTLTGWVLSMLSEAAIGAVLGTSAALIVAGARQAGELVGSQAGLSPAAFFDPDLGDELTPAGHLYGLVATAVFLALDGPLLIVRSLIGSYQTWPVGGFSLSEDKVGLLFGKVGDSLALAIQAAAPVAAALSMAGVALALISKAAPAFPFTALALPIRSMLGLILIAIGLATLVASLVNAWQQWMIAPL